MTKVLVIENESNLRKMVKANMAASGYQVIIAADGEEGLRIARLERPDLILLDLRMPGISGWDVLMALKANQDLQKTQIIIMTASITEDQEAKALSLGAVAYLAKPFGVDELLRKIEQVLGE